MTLEALTLSRGDVRAVVVPARGAIVTSLTVGGVELLYLDRATLDDPAKNVRGGVPILFPFAGKLPDGRLAATGTTMKQHGFGRDRPWAVTEADAGAARLALVLDDASRAAFPFDYEAASGVRLVERGVELSLTVTNAGAAPIPLSPGWHPYFRCPAARKADVTSDAPGFPRERLGDAAEFDLGIAAPASGEAIFHVPGLGGVRLAFTAEMRHLQLWGLPGKDFVCLEPFWGPAGTIDTPARLLVPPGQARALSLRIERVEG